MVLRKYRVLIITLVIVLALPVTAFATFTRVETGTKYVCKYGGQVVKSNTHKTIVARWNAAKYQAKTVKTVCSKHKKLEALYRKAKEALRKGDLALAKKLFEEIKRIDPKFGQVLIELAAIEDQLAAGGGATGTPGGTPGSPGGTSPGGGGSRDTPGSPGDTSPGGTPIFSGDLSSLLPTNLQGYTMISEDLGALSASRQFRSDTHPKVVLLTISAHQLMTEEAANDWIDRNSKFDYAADSRSAQVQGTSAYFGTDGKEFAILAYQINGVVFELEMLAKSGTAPRDLYSDIVAVGSSVP